MTTNWRDFGARGESDKLIGKICVPLNTAGMPPQVARDQHGSTWVLIPSTYVENSQYRRVPCAEAQLTSTTGYPL